MAGLTGRIHRRLEQVERRLDALVDSGLEAPTNDDLMAVRLHSARVAAEVTRVAIELRSEIASLRQPQRPAKAAEIIDLADQPDRLAHG
jgi:hypothetical protein